MKAGLGRCEMVFPEGFFPTEGFTEQLDALNARVLLMQGDKRVAILSLEMTSLPPEAVARMQGTLKEACGADECFVCATHTFSAPHVLPDHALTSEEGRRKKSELLSLLTEGARAAALQAASSLCPVRLAVGRSECLVNASRDVETPAGWWVDTGGSGDTDHRMTALRIEDAAGQVLGALVHYPVQSSVLDGGRMPSGGKAVSGDLAGEISRRVEEKYPGAVAMFLIGAAGDQGPRDKAVRVTADPSGALVTSDRRNEAVHLLRSLGQEAAEAAMAALANAVPIPDAPLAVSRREVIVPAKAMARDLQTLHPTRLAPYEAAGEAAQTIELMTIGGLRLVCVKPELNCVTSRVITAGFPGALVATMVNGGAKYMADAASYDRVTYEAMNSPFGRGAAEKLAEAARDMLAES